jgi:glyoxylase-like metal-dependent hydrolase (beta-lactamase superfamily II)
LFGLPEVKIPQVDYYFEEKSYEFKELKIEIIYTPGHTKGGVCFLIENHLFTGDTLFFKSIGRTDLPTGDFTSLISSIKNQLFGLPNETIVYPGHGENTSIGFERENNPFLN